MSRNQPELQVHKAIMAYLDRVLPEYKYDAQRLVARVEIDENGCWNWQGAYKNKYGVSWFSSERRPLSTHRISLICLGVDIKDKLACHKCDNTRCCNPDHLFPGTYLDNTADCIAKGRYKRPPVRNWPKIMKSARHHWQKLTREQVLEIREERKRGVPCGQLAERYGVTAKHISRVGAGSKKRWAHI